MHRCVGEAHFDLFGDVKRADGHIPAAEERHACPPEAQSLACELGSAQATPHDEQAPTADRMGERTRARHTKNAHEAIGHKVLQ